MILMQSEDKSKSEGVNSGSVGNGRAMARLVNRSCFSIHVVHQKVLAERIWRREIRLSAANLRHFLDEIHETVICGEHEGIDENSLLLAAVHFFEGLTD